MLQAASTLPARQAADVILLGDEADLRARAVGLGLDLTGARIIDPATSELRERFAAEYARLLAHRGVTLDLAREIPVVVSYFGTMMGYLGHDAGLVSGAAHPTSHTHTPSFQTTKT